MDEIWVDIKNYEGRYQISNMGRVRSLDRIDPHAGYYPRRLKGKPLKHLVNKANKYPRVSLGGNRVYVHILVAEHFIGEKPFSDAEVNHKNGIKIDCVHTNLEWVTPSEQIQHAYDTGLKPRLLTIEEIRKIKNAFAEAEAKGVSTYGMGVDLADRFGVSVRVISGIKNNKVARHV